LPIIQEQFLQLVALVAMAAMAVKVELAVALLER
jgi:hypothetical protein